MATVMITKQLLVDVKRKIDKAHQAEYRETCPLLGQNSNIDASDLFNQACWGDHLHLLREIPTDWLKEAATASILCTAAPGVLDPKLEVRTNVVFAGMRSAYWRPTPAIGSYYPTAPTIELTWEQLHERQHLTGAAHCIESLRQAKLGLGIAQKYEALWHQLCAFLGRCRSLNEAVKTMPSIRLYLESEYIERLERKVERAKPAKDTRAVELLEGVDVDVVTGLGAAALLGGSS